MSAARTPATAVRSVTLVLGLRQNAAQFALLVVVNAFVGATIGMERTILPAIAEHEFQLSAHGAILSFIVAFGLAKAATNYWAGRLSDRHGRKPVLIAGWLVAAPVPFLLMWAPSWAWVLGANVAHPSWRASAVGVYRLWRDLGYAVGAVLAGLTADAFGPRIAICLVGAVTFGSGTLAAIRMRETLAQPTANADRS